MNNKEPEYLFKLVVVGDSSVGKSSILLRYSDNDFSDSFIQTIGVDFKIKITDVNGKRVKLQIWDTAGQERFRSLISSYFRGSNGIIYVYDVCNKESFDNIKKWIKSVENSVTDKTKFMLIGNKCDIKKRQVSTQDGQTLASSFNMTFFEVSARTNENIELMFTEFAKVILEKWINDHPPYDQTVMREVDLHDDEHNTNEQLKKTVKVEIAKNKEYRQKNQMKQSNKSCC